jgi:hypothetical protein
MYNQRRQHGYFHSPWEASDHQNDNPFVVVGPDCYHKVSYCQPEKNPSYDTTFLHFFFFLSFFSGLGGPSYSSFPSLLTVTVPKSPASIIPLIGVRYISQFAHRPIAF